MSIIDASLGYCNLKLDKKSSYLTTFACPFGQYQYKWLPFRAAPAGDLFQHKLDKIFSDMQNISGITDDILVIGYDENEADHDAAVHKVLWTCKKVRMGDDMKKRSSTRPTKNQSPNRHAGAK